MKKANLKSIFYITIALGLVGALVAVAQGNKLQPANTANVQVSQAEEEGVLDCAKKVDQKDELAQLPSQSDCLFIGCGNFFQ